MREMDGRMDGWQEVGEGGGSEMNEEALSLSLSRCVCWCGSMEEEHLLR